MFLSHFYPTRKAAHHTRRAALATMKPSPQTSSPYAREALRPYLDRIEVARALAERRFLQGRREFRQAEVLRSGDAALPQRHAAHRPHTQLFDRRCAGPLQVDAWLQRAAPHGLGRLRTAGGERRHRQPAAAARVDHAEYRRDEEDPSPLRLQLRLGPRSLHLRARVLSLEPVVLPEDAGARPSLPQARPRSEERRVG